MSILNCCGCINQDEKDRRGNANKRYKGKKPQKKNTAEDKLLEDGRNSSFFRPEDDSKFRSVQTNDNLKYNTSRREVSPSPDGRGTFNDQHSNTSVILPVVTNMSAISDNNVTRGSSISAVEARNTLKNQ